MSYHGPFVIITQDGTEVQVTGSLHQHLNRGGLKSWDGAATADPADARTLSPSMARVRLPDGGEGDVLIKRVNHRVEGGVEHPTELTLAGSGAPPFYRPA